MNIAEGLQGIVARLEREGIDDALCGGLAVAAYAMPRATLDIDLMIQVDIACLGSITDEDRHEPGGHSPTA